MNLSALELIRIGAYFGLGLLLSQGLLNFILSILSAAATGLGILHA